MLNFLSVYLMLNVIVTVFKLKELYTVDPDELPTEDINSLRAFIVLLNLCFGSLLYIWYKISVK